MVRSPNLQSIRLGRLCFCLAASLLLYASWAWIAASRALWDEADRFVFFHLNGILEQRSVWAAMWSFLNTRLFDMVCGFLYGLLFLAYIRRGDPAGAIMRFSQVVAAAVCIAASIFLGHLLLDYGRQSPNLELQPAYLVFSLNDWLIPKAYSNASFPGDHATVSLFFTCFLWYLAGRRTGLTALAITLVAIMPRLVSGSHWFTDIAIGSSVVLLVSLSVALATPLYARLGEMVRQWLAAYPKLQDIIERLLLFKL